jgi:hypothetical protein
VWQSAAFERGKRLESHVVVHGAEAQRHALVLAPVPLGGRRIGAPAGCLARAGAPDRPGMPRETLDGS